MGFIDQDEAAMSEWEGAEETEREQEFGYGLGLGVLSQPGDIRGSCVYGSVAQGGGWRIGIWPVTGREGV